MTSTQSGPGSRGERAMAISFLMIEKGDGPKNRILLGTFPHVLGRKGYADTGFESPFISRRHAEIVERDGSLWLRDLGSRNKTTINDQEIGDAEAAIKPGDLITLGDDVVNLRLYVEEETLLQPHSGPLTGPVRLDQGTREVWVHDALIAPPLPHKEFDVFALLASKYGKFVANSEIARVGWPERERGDVPDEDIQQIIGRLRHRIAPLHIDNRRKDGYRLSSRDSEP